MTPCDVREAVSLIDRRARLVDAKESVTKLVNWNCDLQVTGNTSGSLGVGREIAVSLSRGAVERLMSQEIESVDRQLKALGVDL